MLFFGGKKKKKISLEVNILIFQWKLGNHALYVILCSPNASVVFLFLGY